MSEESMPDLHICHIRYRYICHIRYRYICKFFLARMCVSVHACNVLFACMYAEYDDDEVEDEEIILEK